MLPFQRFWMRTAAILAAAVCALVIPGCHAKRPGEAEQVLPELKLEDVRFRVYRGETLRASGEAARVSLLRDSTAIRAADLVTVIEGDVAPVRVTAPSGQGVLSTRRFQATGGVVVARGEDVIRTASARYEPDAGGGPGLVHGDEPVEVDGRGYRLEGPRFTLDPATGDMRIEGGARLLAGEREAR